MFVNYWYTLRYYTGYRYMDTLCTSYTTVIYTHRSTCIDCLCILVAWIMVYIIATWIFLDSRYIDHCLCHMDYCYMSSSSCILVTWLFPVLILLFPLLNTWAVDMRCGIPHLLFPFSVILFYAINWAQVLLSCYMYHALYLFYCVL